MFKQFPCPACGAMIQADAENDAPTVRCGKCQALVSASGREEAFAAGRGAEARRDAPAFSSRERGRSAPRGEARRFGPEQGGAQRSSAGLVLGIVFAGAVLVASVVVVILLISADGDQRDADKKRRDIAIGWGEKGEWKDAAPKDDWGPKDVVKVPDFEKEPVKDFKFEKEPFKGPPLAPAAVGRIKAGAEPVTVNDALRADALQMLFEVDLEEGKTYQFDLKSSAFDSFLILQGPGGEVLAQDDDSGGMLNSQIVFRATSAGVYRVIATSLSRAGTGAFVFEVREK
jgi:hypothetical protein